MEANELVELNIEVSAKDATEEEIDEMARNLLAELWQMAEVDSPHLTVGSSIPAGAKGDPITIGSIVLATLPTFLPKVVEAVQAWGTRGTGRTVKFKGKGIDFEGPPEELYKLLAKLEKRKKHREQ